jgi:hypothetical protein
VGEELIANWHSRRVPPVVEALRCAGCGRPSDDAARGWRGCRVQIGGQAEVVFFCPDCTARPPAGR